MTTTLKVRYDGRVLVPETPVDLPVGEVLEVRVSTTPQAPAGFLSDLTAAAAGLPEDETSPGDAAAQHDHYLYGAPKKP